ncbi:hypothetical protein Hypma_005193 [Hypsizygus marmoreus]|uniref:G domain-containing protein n=1 Tax=Hypsizygus marmoreus TaxID=39966 RepID=A0A369J8D9_HYPMA|nr:hypothetical protein Hypma_005193 [Hypsizygus marmoreus]
MTAPADPIRISDLTVKPVPTSKKLIQFVDAQIDGAAVEAQWVGGNGKTRRATFDPPLILSFSQSLTLNVQYQDPPRQCWPNRPKHQTIVLDERILRSAAPMAHDQRELQCRQGKIELLVGLSTSDVASKPTENPDLLLPVTDEILRICPWFRILVIGKTGVGKSTLINKTFGVTDAVVSHNARGDADINKEIFSSTNDKFVLHDSRGFEPGEEHNVEIVQDFINQRSRQPDIKDKLHAVWCVHYI